MGKFITLMVGAVVLGGSYLLFSGHRTTLETRAQQSDYQFQATATNINAGVGATAPAASRVTEWGLLPAGSGYSIIAPVAGSSRPTRLPH